MEMSHSDTRGPDRRARDEQLAAESPLPPLELSADASSAPMEVHLGRLRPNPLAVSGIVENGVIRLLDPTIHLPEHARVIILASPGSYSSVRT